MARWYLKPKRFAGELSLDGRKTPVKFSIAVTMKGVAKLALDTMSLNECTKFIFNAHFDQRKALRFFNFTLTGQSRDGSTFYTDTLNLHSMGVFFSDSAPATITPSGWCLECQINLPSLPGAKTAIKTLLRGFDSIHVVSATCEIGALELRGPMSLKLSERAFLTGALVIEASPEVVDFERWQREVEALFKHVRSVMSFARGARLAAPVVEAMGNGRTSLTVRMIADQEGYGVGAFTPFDYAPIFRQSVASHFFRPECVKNISIAIEWFTMPAGYREAKLTSAMTVLENLLTTNLPKNKLELRPKKEFGKLRDEIVNTARRKLEELGVPKEQVKSDVATLRPKLNDLNRRTLTDKIRLLAGLWGVPLEGISDDALGQAKRARDHIVHQGQYIPRDPGEDLMGHVRLIRELVVRFVLAALQFEGSYTSPMTGEHDQPFKALPPQLD